MIIVGPAHPVTEGDQVTLHCRYWLHKPNLTTFYKDGVEVVLNVTEMTIDNVNGADEGFYKCAEPEEKLESPESWLSVRSKTKWLGTTAAQIFYCLPILLEIQINFI